MKKKIGVFDIQKREVLKTFNGDERNYGITVTENTLLYCVKGKGIKQMNLLDESNGDIVKCKMSAKSYIATFKDNIYYTNKNNHTVTCYDLQGITKWEFRDTIVLKLP